MLIILSHLIYVGWSVPSFAVDRHEPKLKRTYETHCCGEERGAAAPLHVSNRQRKSSDIRRISTPNDHVTCLKDGIARATRSILMTSYGVSDEAFVSGNLYPLLRAATERGVNVYIYNSDSKEIDPTVSLFFTQHSIRYAATFTHAKILAVDQSMVAIGSYSWLAKENTWDNATLCLSGRECKDLVPLLWEDLKHYRHLQFGNMQHIEEYEDDSDNDEADRWNIDRSTTLDYIHSLALHQAFIAEVFKSAEQKIIFCSPFISYTTDYQEDFTKRMLNKVLHKNIHVYFVCRTDDPQLPRLRTYLGDVLESSFMHMITLPNIHQKTVIVDDEMIAEGSFNWFSASRDEESDTHNHEVTLVLDGAGSREAIHDFYDSRIGQAIIRASSHQRMSLPARHESSAGSRTRDRQDPHSYVQQSGSSSSRTPSHPVAPTIDWNVSAKGNPYATLSKGIIDQDTHHVVVVRNQDNTYLLCRDHVTLRKKYATQDEAKRGVFDR